MSFNIAETFELLFNENNNVAYKALQKLKKESEETDRVYPYMNRLNDKNEIYRNRSKDLGGHYVEIKTI